MADKDSGFGPMLARLRLAGGLSQLALSLEAAVSSRHLSFLETGRARPSEPMVRRLATALRLPPEDLDRLLLAAGFAPSRTPAPGSLEVGRGPLGARAFACAVALAGETDPVQAASTAAGFLQGVGIGLFATGTLRRAAGGTPSMQRDRVGRPAVGWLAHFRERDYYAGDAVMAMAAETRHGFFWDEVRARPLSPAQRTILAEAGAFGIADGFVLPVRQPDGSARVFSAWAGKLEGRDPEMRVSVRLVAAALLEALDRARVPTQAPGERAELQPAHRDLLAWVAAGRDVDWIADRRAETGDASRRHMAEAAHTMGTADIGVAAARAVAFGLLDP